MGNINQNDGYLQYEKEELVEKILIIPVSVGVSALAIIVLVLVITCVCYRYRKGRSKAKKYQDRTGNQAKMESELYKRVLIKTHHHLLEHLQPVELLDLLFQEGVVTEIQRRDISELKTTTEINRKLLELLRQNGEKNIKHSEGKENEFIEDAKISIAQRTIEHPPQYSASSGTSAAPSATSAAPSATSVVQVGIKRNVLKDGQLKMPQIKIKGCAHNFGNV